jgi:hypothetical protein
VTLDDDDIEAIADRVIAKLRRPADGLVGVRDIARALGMSAGWVYRNADKLGAQRLGAGHKRTLRFDLARAVQQAAALGPAAPLSTTATRARRRGRPLKREAPAGLQLISPRGVRRP